MTCTNSTNNKRDLFIIISVRFSRASWDTSLSPIFLFIWGASWTCVPFAFFSGWSTSASGPSWTSCWTWRIRPVSWTSASRSVTSPVIIIVIISWIRWSPWGFIFASHLSRTFSISSCKFNFKLTSTEASSVKVVKCILCISGVFKLHICKTSGSTGIVVQRYIDICDWAILSKHLTKLLLPCLIWNISHIQRGLRRPCVLRHFCDVKFPGLVLGWTIGLAALFTSVRLENAAYLDLYV